jgi:NADH dehydrogenase (ubiquinone) Fe-S protein 4
MGWTSTADPLENVARAAMNFHTKEEAIAFAVKSGWGYEVVEPNKRRTDRQKRFMGYGDNFSTKRAGLPDLTHLEVHGGVQKETAKALK